MPEDAVTVEMNEVAPYLTPAAQPDQMLAMIERVVLNPEVPIERMMQLLDMKERLDGAQSRKAFDFAISLAKAEIPPIIKGREVDYTPKNGGQRVNYRHEDLAGIAKVIDPILGKYGLSYRYRTKQEGDRIAVTCVLSHRDGYSEETTLVGGRDESGNKNNFQAVGSAVTYLQRYTLKAALGLAASHDDDSKGADKEISGLTDEQFNTLFNLMQEAGADEKFLRIYGIENLRELPPTMFGAARNVLEQKIAAKAKPNA